MIPSRTGKSLPSIRTGPDGADIPAPLEPLAAAGTEDPPSPSGLPTDTGTGLRRPQLSRSFTVGASAANKMARTVVSPEPVDELANVSTRCRGSWRLKPRQGSMTQFDAQVAAMAQQETVRHLSSGSVDTMSSADSNGDDRSCCCSPDLQDASLPKARASGSRWGARHSQQSVATIASSALRQSSIRNNVRRIMRPVVTSDNAMEVKTVDSLAARIPFIGAQVDRATFLVSKKRWWNVGLMVLWAIGFLAGSLGVCNILGEEGSDGLIFMSVLMIPGEIFPILLFNRRITVALLKHFETWFVMVNMLIPVIVLCIMVGTTRMVFVISSAPGLASIPFMDAYPAFMRKKVVKVYFVFFFVYWFFWLWVLHFESVVLKVQDKKLLQIGTQDHYSAEVCAGSILNVICFGARNVWFALRHPEWFAVLSTPLETIKVVVPTQQRNSIPANAPLKNLEAHDPDSLSGAVSPIPLSKDVDAAPLHQEARITDVTEDELNARDIPGPNDISPMVSPGQTEAGISQAGIPGPNAIGPMMMPVRPSSLEMISHCRVVADPGEELALPGTVAPQEPDAAAAAAPKTPTSQRSEA